MSVNWLQLAIFDFGHIEHFSGRHENRLAVVFVRQKNYFFYPYLNNQFGAVVAGEKRDIQRSTFQIGLIGGIGDGVHFGVADIGIFGIKKISLPVPGELIVGAPGRKAVVADTDDALFGIDDTRTHLGVRVFRAVRRQLRHTHEIVIPTDIVGALFLHERRINVFPPGEK